MHVLFEETGSSSGGTRPESLACELASLKRICCHALLRKESGDSDSKCFDYAQRHGLSSILSRTRLTRLALLIRPYASVNLSGCTWRPVSRVGDLKGTISQRTFGTDSGDGMSSTRGGRSVTQLQAAGKAKIHV